MRGIRVTTIYHCTAHECPSASIQRGPMYKNNINLRYVHTRTHTSISCIDIEFPWRDCARVEQSIQFPVTEHRRFYVSSLEGRVQTECKRENRRMAYRMNKIGHLCACWRVETYAVPVQGFVKSGKVTFE